MKKLFLVSLSIILLIAFVLTGCSQQSPAPAPATQSGTTSASKPAVTQASGNTINLRLTTHTPGTGVIDDAIKWWANEVQNRTNNKVAIKIFFGGTVASSTEALSAVKTGVADIGFLNPANWPDKIPLTCLLANTACASSHYVSNPLAGWKAAGQVRKEVPEWEAEYTSQNMKLISDPIGALVSGVSSKKPIRTLKDFNGLKIRSVTGLITDYYKAAGGVPVFIPSNEAFDALDKGTIDASHGAIDLARANKWYEVGKNFTLIPVLLRNPGYVIAVNLDTWKSLPPDVQQAMTSAGQDWVEAFVQMLLKYNDESLAFYKNNKVEIINLSQADLDSWNKLLDIPALQNAAIADAVKKGAPESAVRKMVQRWIELEPAYVQKYPQNF